MPTNNLALSRATPDCACLNSPSHFMIIRSLSLSFLLHMSVSLSPSLSISVFLFLSLSLYRGHLFRANPTFYSFFPITNCALRARWVTSPWGQKNMSSSQKNSPSGHFWKWTIGSPWLKSWPPPHLLLLSGITSSSSSSFPFPSSSHLSFTYLS